MKPRKFAYTGEPIPKIDTIEHKLFLENFQKAMILSLAERKLLTKNQAERVLEMVSARGACK